MDHLDNPTLYCLSNKFDIIINSNPFTIGRGVNCDYVIPNHVISRLHCQIEKTGNQWFLRDKSTNGTFLNGVLIKLNVSPPLKDTDIIQLSDDSYKYRFQYKCTFKDDISDEQLCEIADSALQNLEEFTEPVCSDSNIINISDSVIPVNAEDPAYVSIIDVQPSKKIKVSPSSTSSNVIDLTNESFIHDNEAPSSSNKEPSIIDLSESLPTSNILEKKMIIEQPPDVPNKLEVGIDVASTSFANNMGQIESQKFKKETNDDMQSQEELLCAICSEMFVKATTLNCSHTFCKVCIDTWKNKQNVCPICRTKITSQVGTLVLDNFIEKIIENSSQDVQKRRKELIEERKQNDKTSRPYDKPYVSLHIQEDMSSDTLSELTESEDDIEEINPEWHDDWNSYRVPYYGGYGNCFSCGRRGHWASGCTFR